MSSGLLERHSYEDWMNDLATDDRGPGRGWQAQHQHRCDACGRFIDLNAPGVSWSQQWSDSIEGPDLHDPTYRCSPCTDKLGIKPTNWHGDGYNGRAPLTAPESPRG